MFWLKTITLWNNVALSFVLSNPKMIKKGHLTIIHIIEISPITYIIPSCCIYHQWPQFPSVTLGPFSGPFWWPKIGPILYVDIQGVDMGAIHMVPELKTFRARCRLNSWANNTGCGIHLIVWGFYVNVISS